MKKLRSLAITAPALAALFCFIIAGCGGGGGGDKSGAAPSGSRQDLKLSVELPRIAAQGSGVTAVVEVISIGSSGAASSVASQTVAVTYDSGSGKYRGSFDLSGLPAGNNLLICITGLSNGTPFAHVATLADTTAGSAADLTVNTASSISALAVMRYAALQTNPQALSAIAASTENSLSSAVSNIAAGNTSYLNSFATSYLQGAANPFLPANWSGMSGLTNALDSVISRMRTLQSAGDFAIVNLEAQKQSYPQSDLNYIHNIIMTFDGSSNFSGQYLTVPGGAASGTANSGSYSISATGTMSDWASGSTNNDYFVISDDNNVLLESYYDLSANPLIGVSIGLRRGSGLNNSILNGTYYLFQYAADQDYTRPMIAISTFTANGNGTYTVHPLRTSNSVTDSDSSGTYSVASNGTVTLDGVQTCFVSQNGYYLSCALHEVMTGNSLNGFLFGVKTGSGITISTIHGTYSKFRLYGTMQGSAPVFYSAGIDILDMMDNGDGTGTDGETLWASLASQANGVRPASQYDINPFLSGAQYSNGVLNISNDELMMISPDGSVIVSAETSWTTNSHISLAIYVRKNN